MELIDQIGDSFYALAKNTPFLPPGKAAVVVKQEEEEVIDLTMDESPAAKALAPSHRNHPWQAAEASPMETKDKQSSLLKELQHIAVVGKQREAAMEKNLIQIRHGVLQHRSNGTLHLQPGQQQRYIAAEVAITQNQQKRGAQTTLGAFLRPAKKQLENNGTAHGIRMPPTTTRSPAKKATAAPAAPAATSQKRMYYHRLKPISAIRGVIVHLRPSDGVLEPQLAGYACLSATGNHSMRLYHPSDAEKQTHSGQIFMAKFKECRAVLYENFPLLSKKIKRCVAYASGPVYSENDGQVAGINQKLVGEMVLIDMRHGSAKTFAYTMMDGCEDYFYITDGRMRNSKSYLEMFKEFEKRYQGLDFVQEIRKRANRE